MSIKIKNLKKYSLKKVTLDPLFQSYWYSKFINKFMLKGKKHVVEKIISNTFYDMRRKLNRAPLNLLFIALLRLKPLVGFISKRLGRNWKKVPVPLPPRRQLVLALKWLVSQVRVEQENTLNQRLVRTFTTFFKHNKITLRTKKTSYVLPNKKLEKIKALNSKKANTKINTKANKMKLNLKKQSKKKLLQNLIITKKDSFKPTGPLIAYKNLHYFNATKDRVNTRFRWA